MTSDDPRVQRAREAANYPTNQHDMHGMLCDLLAVVDELRAKLDEPVDIRIWPGEGEQHYRITRADQ